MQTRDNHIDELIGKSLSGEATAEEHAFLIKWISESEENRRYYNQLKTIFEKAGAATDVMFDTDKAWEKMKARIDNKAGKRARTVHMRPAVNFGYLARIAASVMVLITVGIFVYKQTQSPAIPAYAVASTDKIITDTLPNGSQVVLNRHSTIDYSFDRSTGQHKVALTGEAYFTVDEKSSGKFIVQTGEVFIQDIGTSFNVKAESDGQSIIVTVDEGEVRFYSSNKPGVHVQAGQSGVYNKTEDTFSVIEPMPNTATYKTLTFIFRDTRLEEVVNTLNAVYDTPIVIHDQLKNCRLTVSFDREDIDVIASVIAETLEISMSTESGKIILEGEGCE